MKILMVSYDMQDFGGLEEYAVSLAVALQQQGQQVSWLSAAWVHPENQYARRLRDAGIPLVQPPAWISKPASDWETKERILLWTMRLLGPFVLFLALGVSLLKRRPFAQARVSAYNFLKGWLMDRVMGPDYRKVLARLLLNWWNLRWRPDILHIQGYTTSLLFVIDWAHAKGVPVMYEEHQTPDPQFNWWKGFEATINKADRVIAVSEKSAQGLREVCKVTRPIVVRAPLLSDPFQGKWQRDYAQPAVRPFTVTTLARLYVTKGLTYLLDAAALVKRTHPHIRFRVYGEGELRGELLEKAERLGLNGADIFPGAFAGREELTRIMNETDLFLLSSVLEGQPLVIVEAMAYGCPIVSTNVGGIPELITDGVNGLLCPPAEPECLAEKITRLADDPTLRERLGRAARAFYENSPFEAKAAAAFFAAAYGEVLKERQRLGRRAQGTDQEKKRRRVP
ncbi:MAG: glycosyltransferase family 4 protein [Chloroflexota bacterium]|nr:glycosyltransferase family 4 protein [Chloroflexota bacterium]MBI5702043.1 glycosyltransferase family 4 protein [Chloroflexota bacterium]